MYAITRSGSFIKLGFMLLLLGLFSSRPVTPTALHEASCMQVVDSGVLSSSARAVNGGVSSARAAASPDALPGAHFPCAPGTCHGCPAILSSVSALGPTPDTRTSPAVEPARYPSRAISPPRRPPIA